MGGTVGMAYVRKGQGLSVLDTVVSSWLHQTHSRAQLNPSAMIAAPQGKCT